MAALDGLRAVAVLSVMFFHFGVSFLPGGFVGVDIFFVLSGFLITGILFREHSERGTINLGRFWAFRARRLFPALGAMLIAVAIVTATQSAVAQKAVFDQGIATLLYVNNWYLIVSQTEYFDQFTNASPLLHTWSLGVEEQWYVAFPFVLILLLKYLRLPASKVVAILCLAAVASVLWGAYLTSDGASIDRIYFGTGVRSQELLVGAALAIALANQPLRDRLAHMLGRARRGVGTGGAIVVVVMLMFTDGTNRWQYSAGMFVLALAVAAVIYSVVAQPGILSDLLSYRPLSFIGVISYGLYLWHWPIYVWIRGDGTELAFLQIAAIAILTFGAALISYYLLESRVRAKAWSWTHGRNGWIAATVAPLLIAATLAATTQDRVDVVNGSSSNVVPAAGYSGTGPRVFLLGDSLGHNLRSTYGDVANPGFALTGTTYLGCGVFPNALYTDGQARPNDLPCRQWYEQWHRDLVGTHPDLTVIMLPIQFHHDIETEDGRVLKFGTPDFEQYVKQLLDEATTTAFEGSGRVAIVDGTCNAVPGDHTVARELNSYERTQWLDKVLSDFIQQHPDVSTLKLSRWDCGENAQEARANALARKYDGLHYTRGASIQAWEQLAPQIRELLARPSARAPSGQSFESTDSLP